MPSAIYNESIYAPLRQTKASVSFELIPPEAKEKATVSVSKEAAFSRKAQLIDGIINTTAPLATFEPNYWKLDGSFLLPNPPTKSEIEIGWWGSEISNIYGKFNETPEISVRFSQSQNIPAFSVAFDEAANEMVEDLEFFVYDSAGNLILNERITDNDKTYVSTEKGAFNVTEIKVKFYKTRNPFRRVRVSEIVFGEIIRFNGEDILNVNMISQADPLSRSFPINELNLKIINNGKFDQLDSNSLAQYLHKRQTFEYMHGIEISDGRSEWIYCGAYYLDSWTVSDETVEFTASGKAITLEQNSFYNSTFSKYNIGTLIDIVLKDSAMNYVVSRTLRESPLVAGFLGNVNLRQAVTYLAELGVCMAHENRQNSLEFIDILENKQISDNINYDNMFSSPKIKLDTYYNGVILKEKIIVTKLEQIAKAQFNVTSTMDVTVYFDKPLYGKTPTYTITSGFALTNIVYSAMYMKATIRGNGNAEIVVTGEGATFTTVENFYEAPWKDPLEARFGYVIDLPMIFLDNTDFRKWFLERKFEALKRRLTCDIRWRQNPALDVGETALVQANKNNSNLNMNVISQKIEYNVGVLRGTTKTMGEAMQT